MASDSLNPFKVMTSNLSSICTNTIELEALLSKIGNKEVAVYSINGKFKTGKSFMMNFMLRFLIYGKSYRNNWIYIDLPRQFACDGGANKCTVGIDVWPDVFYVDVGNGKEVAVLLIDTQGIFDDESPVTDNQSVFGFSALLSSLMIYNVINTMDQRDWQFLDFLMSFVNQAIHCTLETGDNKPNLDVLIRDWESKNEFSFGNHTATLPPAFDRNLYYHFFKNSGQAEASETAQGNSNILSHFGKCSVTAMPYPGKELALANNATTSSGDAEFLETVKDYVECIFSPEAVLSNRKKVGGSLVTGESLSKFVCKWATYFQDSSLPAPHSLYLSTAELQHMNLVKSLEEEFKSLVEKVLESFLDGRPNVKEFLEIYVSACTQKFENCKLLGKQDFSEEYKQILCRNLETASKMITQKYDVKIQDAAAKLHKEEVERLKKNHEEQVNRAAEEARLQVEHQRVEVERLMREQEEQRKRIAGPAQLDFERERIELQNLQLELERIQQEILAREYRLLVRGKWRQQ